MKPLTKKFALALGLTTVLSAVAVADQTPDNPEKDNNDKKTEIKGTFTTANDPATPVPDSITPIEPETKTPVEMDISNAFRASMDGKLIVFASGGENYKYPPQSIALLGAIKLEQHNKYHGLIVDQVLYHATEDKNAMPSLTVIYNGNYYNFNQNSRNPEDRIIKAYPTDFVNYYLGAIGEWYKFEKEEYKQDKKISFSNAPKVDND